MLLLIKLRLISKILISLALELTSYPNNSSRCSPKFKQSSCNKISPNLCQIFKDYSVSPNRIIWPSKICINSSNSNRWCSSKWCTCNNNSNNPTRLLSRDSHLLIWIWEWVTNMEPVFSKMLKWIHLAVTNNSWTNNNNSLSLTNNTSNNSSSHPNSRIRHKTMAISRLLLQWTRVWIQDKVEPPLTCLVECFLRFKYYILVILVIRSIH